MGDGTRSSIRSGLRSLKQTVHTFPGKMEKKVRSSIGQGPQRLVSKKKKTALKKPKRRPKSAPPGTSKISERKSANLTESESEPKKTKAEAKKAKKEQRRASTGSETSSPRVPFKRTSAKPVKEFEIEKTDHKDWEAFDTEKASQYGKMKWDFLAKIEPVKKKLETHSLKKQYRAAEKHDDAQMKNIFEMESERIRKDILQELAGALTISQGDDSKLDTILEDRPHVLYAYKTGRIITKSEFDMLETVKPKARSYLKHMPGYEKHIEKKQAECERIFLHLSRAQGQRYEFATKKLAGHKKLYELKTKKNLTQKGLTGLQSAKMGFQLTGMGLKRVSPYLSYGKNVLAALGPIAYVTDALDIGIEGANAVDSASKGVKRFKKTRKAVKQKKAETKKSDIAKDLKGIRTKRRAALKKAEYEHRMLTKKENYQNNPSFEKHLKKATQLIGLTSAQKTAHAEKAFKKEHQSQIDNLAQEIKDLKKEIASLSDVMDREDLFVKPDGSVYGKGDFHENEDIRHAAKGIENWHKYGMQDFVDTFTSASAAIKGGAYAIAGVAVLAGASAATGPAMPFVFAGALAANVICSGAVMAAKGTIWAYKKNTQLQWKGLHKDILKIQELKQNLADVKHDVQKDDLMKEPNFEKHLKKADQLYGLSRKQKTEIAYSYAKEEQEIAYPYAKKEKEEEILSEIDKKFKKIRKNSQFKLACKEVETESINPAELLGAVERIVKNHRLHNDPDFIVETMHADLLSEQIRFSEETGVDYTKPAAKLLKGLGASDDLIRGVIQEPSKKAGAELLSFIILTPKKA